jgi:hypothetical protein
MDERQLNLRVAQLMTEAVEAYGSQLFFARYLGIPLEELRRWMDGEGEPTEEQIRRAGDVIVSKTNHGTS